jgi:serine protease AprX
VIVQFKTTPTTSQHQKVFARGGTLRSEPKSVKAGAYTMPSDAIENLAKDPEVAHISPDRKLKGLLDLSAAPVNASAAWQAGFTGTGIGISIIDRGISSRADLNNSNGVSRVVYSQTFVGGGPAHLYGHGEQVTGIVAGDGSLSTGTHDTCTSKGMVPNANIIDLRALDQVV